MVLLHSQAEATKLWSSVTSAQLLLAGDITLSAADAISRVAQLELQAVLPQSASHAMPWKPPAWLDLEDELAQWDGKLYQPSFTPLPLARSICLDPAIAEVLDQCGGV